MINVYPIIEKKKTKVDKKEWILFLTILQLQLIYYLLMFFLETRKWIILLFIINKFYSA